MAAVEFYQDGGGLIVAVDNESAVPREGEKINILGKTWDVKRITWAVDQPTGLPPRLRANVEMDLEK